MRGLGMWTRTLDKARRARPKARKKILSQGTSLLSKKELTSSSRESAAVHYVQTDFVSFSDVTSESDNDPAVVRTVETLSVVGSDVPTVTQEKETRSSGGILSR